MAALTGRSPMKSPGAPALRREVERQFWREIAKGLLAEEAADAVGVSQAAGCRWFRHGGGTPPIDLAPQSGRYLSFHEREEIAILKAQGIGVRETARRLGRDPSTVSRELRSNAATRGGRLDYRASVAQANPDGYSVARLCRVLGVNRSTYYSWLAARPAVAERQCADDELAGCIREIHAASRGAYGVPRVHAELRRRGHDINRKRVERIMRERDIRGITRRRRRHLTRQDAKAAAAPDLVGRDFTAKKPGTKLVGDITYLPTMMVSRWLVQPITVRACAGTCAHAGCAPCLWSG
ncbi:IS3 family transposase, partial [Streptomyces sp. NPDC002573]|uniref:IS3 family transposase n=1 Tax=Streptomyces sp. NPDC002573 TaxID=3364651 RepID=UPI003678D2AA